MTGDSWPCGDPTCDRADCQPNYQPTPHVCQMCERPLDGHWWYCLNPTLESSPSALPTENARRYAREFASEQLRSAAKWCMANGYDEAAVNHLIIRAVELWPATGEVPF